MERDCIVYPHIAVNAPIMRIVYTVSNCQQCQCDVADVVCAYTWGIMAKAGRSWQRLKLVSFQCHMFHISPSEFCMFFTMALCPVPPHNICPLGLDLHLHIHTTSNLILKTLCPLEIRGTRLGISVPFFLKQYVMKLVHSVQKKAQDLSVRKWEKGRFFLVS